MFLDRIRVTVLVRLKLTETDVSIGCLVVHVETGVCVVVFFCEVFQLSIEERVTPYKILAFVRSHSLVNLVWLSKDMLKVAEFTTHPAMVQHVYCIWSLLRLNLKHLVDEVREDLCMELVKFIPKLASHLTFLAGFLLVLGT